MGYNISKCEPRMIKRDIKRELYDKVLSFYEGSSASERRSRELRSIVNQIFLSLCNDNSDDIKINITGMGNGRIFLNLVYPKVEFKLKSLCLNNCGLDSTSAIPLVELLDSNHKIECLDLSNNDIGVSCSYILSSCFHVKKLIMINCNLDTSSYSTLIDLIKYSRNLRGLFVSISKATDEVTDEIYKALQQNVYINECSIGKRITAESEDICSRNSLCRDIFSKISAVPFDREFSRRVLNARLDFCSVSHGIISETADDINNSNKSLLVSKHESAGKGRQMEGISIIQRNCPTVGYTMFAIFDGHGNSANAAKYAANNLPEKIRNEFRKNNDLKVSIQKAFETVNTLMEDRFYSTGTTACVVFISDKHIVSANLGDTTAVLFKKDKDITMLSKKHTYADQGEVDYAKKNGGQVVEGESGCLSMLSGRLKVSRALGDGEFRKFLDPNPYIYEVEISDDCEYIVIGCDGLWSFVTEDEIRNIVDEKMRDDPDHAAEALVEKAINDGKSTDNVSVLVVYLKKLHDR